ncbi:MAG TPA: dihydrolipoyl dehydrogenase [Candidatus Eisenbacteria bacterium]|nr:dihydrolipoyl dehydrogenase [Candidatus Eisenbacteria bacterium]
MASYDVVVIGAGPGGYVAAIRVAQLGLHTAVVEADRAGGVCGNWGCIPSKAILHDAALAADLRAAAKQQLIAEAPAVDFGRVIDRSRGVADRQAKGVEALFKKNKIDFHHGRGRLVPHGVMVAKAAGGEERLEARNVILATGSAERVLPGLTIDGDVICTSREALERRTLPASVVVIGGGAVGVEFAYAYRSFGAAVTVVEMAEQILPGMDADLGKELARQFGRQGIEVLVGHRVESVVRSGDGAQVTVRGGDAGRTLEAHMVLVAVGRGADPSGLGLDAAGIRSVRGRVEVDGTMRTSAPGVYAIGDLVGPLLLAHAASEQGVIAAEAIAGAHPRPFDPDGVPMCVYCEPEVAAVGLSEAEAKRRGLEVKIGTFPFRALGKAMAVGHLEGFVKVVLDARYEAVLGVHMIGHGVTELIAAAGLARTLEATADDVIATSHAHPTLSEALREATLAAVGRAVNI